MGYKLAEECQRYAPDTLTWRERATLYVLAGEAFDNTRLLLRGIENNADLRQRLRLNRTSLYEVIRALVGKGALIRRRRGGAYHHAEFEIPEFVTRAETADAASAISVSDARQQSVDSTAIASGFHGGSVRVPQTPIHSPVKDQDRSDLTVIARDEIKLITGENITADAAGIIVNQILGQAAGRVSNRAAYVRKSIRNEADPRGRFLSACRYAAAVAGVPELLRRLWCGQCAEKTE